MVSSPIIYILIEHFAGIKVIQAVVEVEIEFCGNNSNIDPGWTESGKREEVASPALKVVVMVRTSDTVALFLVSSNFTRRKIPCI